MNKENQVGVVNGLAWTAVGGTTLTIEATVMKGKGNLTLTGSLGNVMKESATAAVSYIAANAEKFNIKEDFRQKTTSTSMFQKEQCQRMDHLQV